MPIRQLLEGSMFEPEDVDALVKAFEAACAELQLAKLDDPFRQLVAEKVIECARSGERDPERLCKKVLSVIKR